MTPTSGMSQMVGGMFGSANGGLVVGVFVPLLTGAMIASAVISLMRHDHSRLLTTLRNPDETAAGRTLEELLAEKEHLEDLIAEAAAKQSKK